MIRILPLIAALAATTVTAGCGIDGPPVPPTRNETGPRGMGLDLNANNRTGLRVSGEARVGVVF